ncbi:MAG: luciferase family protein [Candidatus Dormibacteria bacterium]
MTAITLPRRAGSRPQTHYGLPHQQLDQQPADPQMQERLAARVFVLPRVHEEESGISVPGARALVLDEEDAKGPREAFMVGREFAHLHPRPDQSLHMALPVDIAQAAIDAGWAELHPMAAAGRSPKTQVMVFAPRDHHEVDVVVRLVEDSYRFATQSRP